MNSQNSILFASTEIKVRFNDCDPLGIVWHGNYVTYLEDSRAAFGDKYEIGYLDIYNEGFVVPIVNINCDYKSSLKFGEKAIVEVNHVFSPAAKLIFEYQIRRASDNEVALTGETTQVFLNNDGVMQLNQPKFYVNWLNNYY